MLGKSTESKLVSLYGSEVGRKTFLRLVEIVGDLEIKSKIKSKELWSQKDIALITYPDSISEKNTPTLKTLSKFLDKFVKNKFEILHVLPFYPYSADRGFSITGYFEVSKKFGTWKDIKTLSNKYRLMTDLISNHVSKKHKWFREFVKGNKIYEDYFIWFTKDNYPPEGQIKIIRRGRPTPVLNPFKTKKGIRYLWSTYSIGNLIDQIDLNYKNPEVFLEIVKVFLFYIKKGINILRFDGIGGLWKELGTSCKHLPQNHTIVSLLREIGGAVNPNALIFTETTTATFEENISYMAKGQADVVYNFTLAPLVLLSFYSGSAKKLSDYAKKIDCPKNKTLFNILDIHDGINMYSASEFLDASETKTIIANVKERGGEFSYRSLSNGERAIKELNITWWSALSDDNAGFEINLRKFITSRAIAMALKGIPAVYYLSLFGAKNDTMTFGKTKHGRDLNRTTFLYGDIFHKMADKNSRESRIFKALEKLVEKRKIFSAFHPDARQKVLNLDKRLFALLRGRGNNSVLALHNVSKDSVEVKYKGKSFLLEPFSYIWQKI